MCETANRLLLWGQWHWTVFHMLRYILLYYLNFYLTGLSFFLNNK